MSFINRSVMRATVHHVLNDGIAGVEKHRADVVHILSELTDAQLAVHLHALEQSLALTRVEIESRQ